MNRRDLLSLLGIGAGTIAAVGLRPPGTPEAAAAAGAPAGSAPFRPVPTPLPVPSDGLDAAGQRRRYARIDLEDRLVLPEGYRSEVLAVWGDPLADGRFGFNNDHLSFLALGRDRALLTVNFEYISAKTWREGYAEAVGEAVGGPLPFAALIEALAPSGGRVDASVLPPDDPLRSQIRQVAAAAMADLGVGVIELERDPGGPWRRRPGRFDRRITGLSGWRDPSRRLGVTGPAAAVFRRRRGSATTTASGRRSSARSPTAPAARPPGARCSAPRRTCRARCPRPCMPTAPRWLPRSGPSSATASGWRAWAIPSLWRVTSTAGWWRSTRAGPGNRR